MPCYKIYIYIYTMTKCIKKYEKQNKEDKDKKRIKKIDVVRP